MNYKPIYNNNNSEADRLKHLVNHELIHASHYTVIGNNFWMTGIAAQIKADELIGKPYTKPI